MAYVATQTGKGMKMKTAKKPAGMKKAGTLKNVATNSKTMFGKKRN